MRQFIIFILLLVFFEYTFSQDERYLNQNTNLYNVKLQFDTYYDSIPAGRDLLLRLFGNPDLRPVGVGITIPTAKLNPDQLLFEKLSR